MIHKSISIVLITALVLACGQNAKNDRTFLPESVGAINALQVVAEDALWNGPVGDSIQGWFAGATPGLPQSEPLFSISHLTPELFSDFARHSRLNLVIALADQDTSLIKSNAYARPQLLALVQGTSQASLLSQLNRKKTSLIAQMKAFELKERQRRTRISPKTPEGLAEDFGVEIQMPSAYRTAVGTPKYHWFRKELDDNGSTNILVYEAPTEMLPQDTEYPGKHIRHIRDAVGSKLLPVEDDSRFITDTTYVPEVAVENIAGRQVVVTRGIWTLNDAYMAGPFFNMAIRDTVKNRVLILEGFSYAPAMAKRDLQFELESILRTVKFIDHPTPKGE